MGRAWVAACLAAAALAGCQSAGSGPATTGAIVAYSETGEPQPGGILTNQIALSLSADDREMARAAEYRALEAGRAGFATHWRGRAARGEILVGPIYNINDSECREYTHMITPQTGLIETGHGTACRGANGTWLPIA
jgi:surface antigen